MKNISQIQVDEKIILNTVIGASLNSASEQAGLCGSLFSATAKSSAFKATFYQALSDDLFFSKYTTSAEKAEILKSVSELFYTDYRVGRTAIVQAVKASCKTAGIKDKILIKTILTKSTDKVSTSWSYFLKNPLLKLTDFEVSFNGVTEECTVTRHQNDEQTKLGAELYAAIEEEKEEKELNEEKGTDEKGTDETRAPQQTTPEIDDHKKEVLNTLKALSPDVIAHTLIESLNGSVSATLAAIVSEFANQNIEVMELLTTLEKSLPATIKTTHPIEFEKVEKKVITKNRTTRQKKVDSVVKNALKKTA